MKMQAVIFDFDGLLIDSEIVSYQIYHDLLLTFGVVFTKEEYAKHYSGKTEVNNVMRLISTYQLPWTLEDGLKKVLDMEATFLDRGIALKPGAKQLLVDLKQKGILLGLATSSTKERALKILVQHELDHIFDECVFGNEVVNSKPAPDIFLKACEKLGMQPEACWVLEDSEAGIQAACHAHMPVICVPDMKRPHSRYLEMCEATLPSLLHVQDFLRDETETLMETKRLKLRQLSEHDFSALCHILQNDDVMHFYEGAFSDEEVHAWLNKQLNRYKEDGIGLYAVIQKETNELIGQCGLTIQQIEDQAVVEIGYLFRQDYWHQGYALEAARSCKEYAFKHFGYEEVYSIIRDNNIPSQRVALRNGMTCKGMFIKHYRGVEMPHLVFSIRRDQKDTGDLFYDTRDLKNDELYLNLTHTCAAEVKKNWLAAYYFDICTLDGRVMGKCDLRIGHNENTYIGGNIGYCINEAYRGHHYAGKACKLLFKLARQHHLHHVIITCDPNNHASAKTCEWLGGKLIEITNIPKENDMYARGMRQVMIYHFDVDKAIE